MIVCAGNSERGRDYAARNADMMFTAIRSETSDLPDIVGSLRKMARGYGREIGVFTNVAIVCRPTRKEAEEYHHYSAVEMADREAAENMVVGRGLEARTMPESVRAMLRLRAAGGNGALPIVGDPDTVARTLADLHAMGVDAFAMGFANYLLHFPYFRDEVLPRLADAGLRGAGAA
jgi:alkanesulfonate monooxygenase SsuD/methylene tetrahydromethanopterin reductase-like flavin-dependent oxidoreductase (luciferase family)